MRRRRDFYEDEAQSMGLGRASPGGFGRSGGAMRFPGRGTRYFQPDEGLMSRPFAGFPGGQTAWEAFKMTGEVPQNLTPTAPLDAIVGPTQGSPTYLTPEQRDFYQKHNPFTLVPGINTADYSKQPPTSPVVTDSRINLGLNNQSFAQQSRWPR